MQYIQKPTKAIQKIIDTFSPVDLSKEDKIFFWNKLAELKVPGYPGTNLSYLQHIIVALNYDRAQKRTKPKHRIPNSDFIVTYLETVHRIIVHINKQNEKFPPREFISYGGRTCLFCGTWYPYEHADTLLCESCRTDE